MRKPQKRDLTVKEVEAIIKAGIPNSHTVGNGLYLRIRTTGSVDWFYRYQLHGKRRLLGIGGYDRQTNNLSMARRKADQVKVDINNGIDPAHLNIEKAAAAKKKLEENRHTFEQVAQEYIDTKKAEWKNAKHHQQWENTLKRYAFPTIGNLPVSEINTDHILKILKPIWSSKTETATRVRTRIELVLEFAQARNWRDSNNPARWRGHMSFMLPAPRKLKKVRHHPALPYNELQPFMTLLSKTDGIGARALETAILTASRSVEVLAATWQEVDLDGRIWTIPAERMKAGVEHRIPLSNQAFMILQRLNKQRISDYVFPNQSTGAHLSNAGMSSVLKRLGRSDITVHGFRSTFRDWVAEKTDTPERIAESALAHKLKDASEAAYQRGDLIEKRQILMNLWAHYCYPSQRKNAVLPIRATGISSMVEK